MLLPVLLLLPSGPKPTAPPPHGQADTGIAGRRYGFLAPARAQQCSAGHSELKH